jgi:hypothetical protein
VVNGCGGKSSTVELCRAAVDSGPLVVKPEDRLPVDTGIVKAAVELSAPGVDEWNKEAGED